MAVVKSSAKLLIKRYASRRLYNAETSDYVTLADIAGLIRAGRDVQIIDLKSGADLTRQYLLQIIAEHEAGDQSVLPVELLSDLVRGYTGAVPSVVPQFLAMSYATLRGGRAELVDELSGPLTAMPGFKAMQAQQSAFAQATGGAAQQASTDTAESELDEIKRQLAGLQARLAKF